MDFRYRPRIAMSNRRYIQTELVWREAYLQLESWTPPPADKLVGNVVGGRY